jgi:hypothetical protein
MSPTSHASRRAARIAWRRPDVLHRDVLRDRTSPQAVLVLSLLACAAFVADAVSSASRFGLLGLAALGVSVALTLRQALRAHVGRPWRTSRRAASAGTAASLVVSVFLASVGVLERMGPEVTGSGLFALGVAGMSVLLIVVLPLALVVFGWTVARDPRLTWWVRVLPGATVTVLAATSVTAALIEGRQEFWLQASAVFVSGALLTAFSVGLPHTDWDASHDEGGAAACGVSEDLARA